MGEIDPRTFHRREAQRFLRLAEVMQDEALKRRLMNAARQHRQTANSLAASGGSHDLKISSSPGGQRAATPYCMHFMDGPRTIGMQEIGAETDGAAVAIAFAIHDACSDVCTHFELRQGARLLAGSRDRRGPRRPANWSDLRVREQESLLRAEELLLSSPGAIAQSRRLLEASDRLRERMAAMRAAEACSATTPKRHEGVAAPAAAR